MIHLFRGAPPARPWSKYQQTGEGWTLCGVDRQLASERTRQPAECTEDAEKVSCVHCRTLMACRAARPAESLPPVAA
jgi:hypothetical protein